MIFIAPVSGHSSPYLWPRRLTRHLHLALAGFLFAALPAVAALAATPAETFAGHTAGSSKTVDHSAWDGILKTYVVLGQDGVSRVAYAKLKSEARDRLAAYIAALEAADPRTLDRPEQFAYWANLYNAKTVAIILDAYPVASIKDISLGGGLVATLTGGPWKAKVLKVAGADLSLDDIEHGILRPLFKDPRVHYAVNCASYGCPNLGPAAFTGATLEASLDAAAKAYVNHPRGVRVEGGQAILSSIYSWFEEDFGGNEDGILAHVRKYASPALKAQLVAVSGISDYSYDWSLNDVAH